MRQSKYRIEKMLTLSPDHVRESTWESMKTGDLASAYEYEYGLLMTVSDDADLVEDTSGWPDDFKRIFRLAANVGAQWIRWDVDEPPVEGLTVYSDQTPMQDLTDQLEEES